MANAITKKMVHFTGVVGSRSFDMKVQPIGTESYIDAIRRQCKDSIVRDHLIKKLMWPAKHAAVLLLALGGTI